MEVALRVVMIGVYQSGRGASGGINAIVKGFQHKTNVSVEGRSNNLLLFDDCAKYGSYKPRCLVFARLA